MNDAKVIYKILKYLQEAMDYDAPDLQFISADNLKISENRWAAIMEMITDEGYVKGATVTRTLNNSVMVSCKDIRITFKGIEFLEENSLMKKMAKAAKGITDII